LATAACTQLRRHSRFRGAVDSHVGIPLPATARPRLATPDSRGVHCPRTKIKAGRESCRSRSGRVVAIATSSAQLPGAGRSTLARLVPGHQFHKPREAMSHVEADPMHDMLPKRRSCLGLQRAIHNLLRLADDRAQVVLTLEALRINFVDIL